MDSVQRQLAEFATSVTIGGLPDAAMASARARVTAALADMIAGAAGAADGPARRLAGQFAPASGATILGTGGRASAAMAAMANCASAGSVDAALVAPVLAVVERARGSGASLVEGVAVAFAAEAWLAGAAPLAAGFARSDIVAIAGALGCGRAMGLGIEALGHGVGLAAVTGVTLADQGPSGPVELGLAARAAVFAAEAAGQGMSGPALPFTGKTGWFAQLVAGPVPDAAADVAFCDDADEAATAARFRDRVAPLLGPEPTAAALARLGTLERARDMAWLATLATRRAAAIET